MSDAEAALTVPAPLPCGQRAARPRPASSVLIFRTGAREPSVLLGRRGGGHAFMPGAWVFPGGRVERADLHAPLATDLDPDAARILASHLSPARARALALAGVRETFEETGLLLAHRAKPRAVAGPWGGFLAQGALPDLAALDVVGRAVTPPMVGRRFDTWFFMADAAALLHPEPGPGCGELEEIAWFGLDRAMSLDLPHITRFILAEAVRRLDDRGRPRPYLRMLRGTRLHQAL